MNNYSLCSLKQVIYTKYVSMVLHEDGERFQVFM